MPRFGGSVGATKKAFHANDDDRTQWKKVSKYIIGGDVRNVEWKLHKGMLLMLLSQQTFFPPNCCRQKLH